MSKEPDITNHEAAPAKVLHDCEKPVLHKAICWLVAMRQAEEMRDWNQKNIARLLMDGVVAYKDLSVDAIIEDLYSGIDEDDDEDSRQIFIEEIDQEIEEYCTEAREEEERRSARG